MSFTDEMLYAAFRAAFVLTLDCMLRESLDHQQAGTGATGFLDVYPVLQGAAPQIQLECLLQTWEHLHRAEKSLKPFDHCVVNAAYEALAKMGKMTTRRALSDVWKGPRQMITASDHWVTSKARAVQLLMDEKAVSELVQMEASLDDHRPVSRNFSESETTDASDDMISVVGRWTASGAVVLGSKGLLTDDEQDILRIFFEEQTGLLR